MEGTSLLIDKTMKKVEFLFRYAGINIRSGEQKSSNYFWSRCLFVVNLLWLGIDLAGAIYWFIDGVLSGKDFLSLTYIAPCISLSTMANIKGIFLILNEKHSHKLIVNMRNMEKTEKKRKQSTAKREIAERESKFLNFVMSTMTTLYGAVILTFTLSPFAIMGVKYQNTGELELILPFLVLYPFDSYQIKVWPFVYLHQFWSECVVSLVTCSADYFFFICCTYLHIQFCLLQHDLAHIIPIQEQSNRKFYEDEDFRRELKELVKWHQDLIESANILEIIYSKSILFNFLSSSLVICLTGFNVTMVKDAALILTFLSFLFMSLVQVFFLCFFADLLSNSSMQVSDAIYNSQFYMAEPKVGRNLLLIQTRSQRPCTLTASGFAEVNLNSFMRVLSTAWSYFALLQTMYGN